MAKPLETTKTYLSKGEITAENDSAFAHIPKILQNCTCIKKNKTILLKEKKLYEPLQLYSENTQNKKYLLDNKSKLKKVLLYLYLFVK